VARLGELVMVELAMVVKVNLTGFEQTEVVRLKSDGTGQAAVRLRSDSYEQVATGLRGDFGHVTEGLHSNRWARGQLM
jgi:hypothetical protein